MNISASTESAVAAIEEYERTCVHLIDSVSNTLKWTIGWLIVTLVFNVFLFYVNAVACDKLRKIREEINGLRLDLAKRQQFVTKSMKSMLQMTARMENVQLDQRLDRVIDKYNDSYNSSTPSVTAPVAPSASAGTPSMEQSRPLTPEPLLNDDTVELLPASEEEINGDGHNLMDVEAHFSKLEEKVNIHLDQAASQCSEKEKIQLERHMTQLQEMKNNLKSLLKRKPP